MLFLSIVMLLNFKEFVGWNVMVTWHEFNECYTFSQLFIIIDWYSHLVCNYLCHSNWKTKPKEKKNEIKYWIRFTTSLDSLFIIDINWNRYTMKLRFFFLSFVCLCIIDWWISSSSPINQIIAFCLVIKLRLKMFRF